MQPLAGCLTHHFLRPVSGRPIVCHDGKDTNFIAYLQANRNIFYNGGNATQCLLPTAARHPILQANAADAATAAGHRPNRSQKPRNQPLAEALGIGPQHLPFGNPKRAVRQCKNGRLAGQYNKRGSQATAGPPLCKHCPARRHCRRAVAPGHPYPQKATWPKTPAATRPGRQRPFNRQTSMQDTTAMTGTPCQSHGTGMAKNHCIVANSPWLHGRKGCTMAKNSLQEFRFSVGRKWKTPLIFNHLRILRL